MAFTPLGRLGTPGVDYQVDDPPTYQDANRVMDNFDDHESRMLALEGSLGGAILSADPASPDDDTWWMVTDGASPASLSVKARLGGVTYTFPLGTATT